MKVGVLGSGDVGQVIATGFANLGYEVKIGTRTAGNEKANAWLEKTKGKKTSVGTFEETAKFGDVIVVAVLGEAVEEAVKLAGISNFDSKTVIDVTNPLDFSVGVPPRHLYGFSISGGEKIQAAIPKANVVKTLNTVGHLGMINPKFKQGEPDMLLCGNNEAAKKQVEQILRDFGWKNITDLGGIEQSRITEAFCILWVAYGAKNKIWTHALKMLKE
jgi:predicted dinucleotide-binding enzyme